MKKANFRDWNVEKIEDTFGIEQISEHPLLNRWVSLPYEISEYEKITLLKLQNYYKRRNTFVSDKGDIFDIYKILKGLRHEIEALLN